MNRKDIRLADQSVLGFIKRHQGSGQPFKSLRPLLLASASPRRLNFLRLTGLDFLILPSFCPEPKAYSGESAVDYAQRSARAKAMDIAQRLSKTELEHTVILSADTVVESPRGRLLGKPASQGEAVNMLMELFSVKNMAHNVITACCLICSGPESNFSGLKSAEDLSSSQTSAKSLPYEFYVKSQVIASGWDQQVLTAYAAGGEGMDKAGAYAIQGQGSFLIKEIQGSFTNVVGLPMAELALVLKMTAVAATNE